MADRIFTAVINQKTVAQTQLGVLPRIAEQVTPVKLPDEFHFIRNE